MITRSPFDGNTTPTPHGVQATKLYDTDDAQVMHLTLAPGQALKKNLTPVDVFFYVLEGKGTVLIGEEEQEVGPDTLIESPKDIVHAWTNTGTAPFRVLVVKTPKPTSPTIFPQDD